MNLELKIYKFIANNLPKIPHITGITNRILKKIYYRNSVRKFEKYLCTFRGITLEVEPYETVDGAVFFHPHIYDKEELDFIESNLNYNDIFIDLGSNIGVYSLVAAKKNSTGKVISIEADPYNYQKLIKNINLNNFRNVIAINKGVSDKPEILEFYINTTGNRGGSSFKPNNFANKEKILVQCDTLLNILKSFNILNIDFLKLDIEGFEYKVLKNFFENSTEHLWPRFIILEYLHIDTYENPLELLKSMNYETILKTQYNIIMKNDLF